MNKTLCSAVIRPMLWGSASQHEAVTSATPKMIIFQCVFLILQQFPGVNYSFNLMKSKERPLIFTPNWI